MFNILARVWYHSTTYRAILSTGILKFFIIFFIVIKEYNFVRYAAKFEKAEVRIDHVIFSDSNF